MGKNKTEKIHKKRPPCDSTQIERKYMDVAYYTDSQSQKMDIYIPNEGQGPFPLIVYIHGGAFKGGDKGDFQVQPYFQAVKKGYAVASINYRLSGEAIFPAAVRDCKAAIRFLKAHAAEYSVDPDRIAAAGGSAGANLTCMICASAGRPELEDLNMGNAGFDSSVQCGVSWFAPTDFLLMEKQLAESGFLSDGHDDSDSPESEYMGGHITEMDPEYVEKGNPMTYVTSSISPLLLQHGRKDHSVPYQQSAMLAEKIREAAGGEKVIFEILEDADHGDPLFETSENMERVISFLDKHLKK